MVWQVKNRLKKALTKKLKKPENIVTIPSPTIKLLLLNSKLPSQPSLSWDFSTTSFPADVGPIANLPVSSQENLLIEDLLNILMGLHGNYIEPKELKDPYDVREFIIADGVNTSLKAIIERILPLASFYSMAQRFVEEKMQFKYGKVNNALAEAIRNILSDYLVSIIVVYCYMDILTVYIRLFPLSPVCTFIIE